MDLMDTWRRKGFKSKAEYDDSLAIKRGYSSFRDYHEALSREKGYKSFSAYIYAKEKERRIMRGGTPYQIIRKEHTALCILLNDIISNIPVEIKDKLNIEQRLKKITQCSTPTRKPKRIKMRTVLDLLKESE